MILQTVCVLLMGLFFPTNCATSLDIVHGQDVMDISEVPYMSAIIKVYYDMSTGFTCGASILDETTILTSARCGPFDDDFLNKVRLIVGETNITGAPFLNISECYQHEEYNNSAPWRNDIAICKLQDPLTFSEDVQPIKLPETKEPFLEGEEGLVTGWGIREDGQMPRVLQKLNVTVSADDYCEGIWAERTIVTADSQIESLASNRTFQLCAQSPAIRSEVCYGDVGGPLAIGGVQYGIVSYMDKVCGDGYPGVYTRVSHYLDWILSKMQK